MENVMDLMQNRPRNFRRLTETQKWKSLIPVKPRKVASGYGLFVSDYWRRQRNRLKGTRANEVIQEISRVWRELSREEKNRWALTARRRREQYLVQHENWGRIKNLMVIPKSPYSIFVGEYWNQRKNDDVNFWEIQGEISQAWKNMDANNKLQYKRRFMFLNNRFNEERRAVISGQRLFNLNWRQEADRDYEEAHQRDNAFEWSE